MNLKTISELFRDNYDLQILGGVILGFMFYLWVAGDWEVIVRGVEKGEENVDSS